MQQTSVFEYELPTWYKKYNTSGIEFDLPEQKKTPSKAATTEKVKTKSSKRVKNASSK